MAEIHKLNPCPDFISNRAGTPYATVENFRRMLRSHGITIQYNEIRKEIDVVIPDKKFLPDNYLNCCLAELTSMCEGYRMASKFILRYVLLIADENKINPVAKWIESKPWDGISRLDKFFATIKSTSEPIKEMLMMRWMVSAMAAIYEPLGISAGGMMVLLARQYMGKTNWFKNLVPTEVRQFIADGMSVDPHNRDSFMPCLENWLVELGEIDATFKRADLAALKAFINRQRDVTRLSYATSNSRFPRRTVFFGSVDKKSYLTDPAGNRRFWTIECKEIDHTHGLDMQQIWAEFKVLYDNGEPWLLSSKEHEMLTESNKEFEALHPIEEKILQKYNWDLPCYDFRTATQILEELGIKNYSHGDTIRCGSAIRKYNKGISKTIRGAQYLAIPPTSF